MRAHHPPRRRACPGHAGRYDVPVISLLTPRGRACRSWQAVWALALAGGLLAGCGAPQRAAPLVVHWIVGRVEPAFDPDGPPDALRWSLERQLSRGLTERDSTGGVRLGLARAVEVSADSVRWTFRLREGLVFTDSTPITSAHFAAALKAGLGRTDHGTRAWVLAALAGVSRVRAGKPLPPLGIAMPDAHTLVLTLAHPDRGLLERLSVPGVSTPWRSRTGSWRSAVGSGPYRVVGGEAGRTLTLAKAAPSAGERALADTVRVRFATGSARVLHALRAGAADLVWPLPPDLVARALPEEYAFLERDAVPERRLLLVLRADVPPTNRPEVRSALANALSRPELVAALGRRAAAHQRGLPGATAGYEWVRVEPRRGIGPAEHGPNDPRTKRTSYHLKLAFDPEVGGEDLARRIQGRWARAGHYAELEPARGSEAVKAALARSGAQAILVESQALFTGGPAELAIYVDPLRGPAVGNVRTGWRTREFDRWVSLPEPAPGFDPDAAQSELARGQVVLPLASLPWQMAVRNGATRASVHPAFGPGWTAPESASGSARSR